MEFTASTPPTVKRIPQPTEIHGDILIDDYRWLREKENPEVLAYLDVENAYTDAVMQSTEAFQETLYREMLARIQEDDVEVPYRDGEHLYYSRTEQGKQYRIICRKRADGGEAEEILLDLNAMASGYAFFSAQIHGVTDDGNRLAYSTDTTGYRQYTLHVKDLRTGETTADLAERVTSAAWAADGRTLCYTVEDATTKRSHRFYRRCCDGGEPELLYEEADERFGTHAWRSRSRECIFLGSESCNSTECRYLMAAEPGGALRVVLPREAMHRYQVDHHGDRFFIVTNDGAKEFRLVTAPMRDPARENWVEILPGRENVTLTGVDMFADHWIAYEREDGLTRVRVTRFDTGESRYLDFPEPVYSVYPAENMEFRTDRYRFRYQSFVTPSSVYEEEVRTGDRLLLKRTEVLGGYDASQYGSERIHATAPDGTRVPISMVYRKPMAGDGTRPLLLQGYGSYGLSSSAGFSSERLSLLDRGMVFAIAHVRGGGELGEAWHDDGKMLQKPNTFTDFVAAADHLVAEGYASRDGLVIEGGSAGGLLIGAVLNLRPDLCRAAVLRVPFVDVINTMLDESMPLTVGEFEEWGNPKIETEYRSMRSYSPYDNLRPARYPAMLVRTSLNDSQVMYWEPAKYVARLRATKTDGNPLLLKTNMGGGHGGASGRYDRLRDVAFDDAFILGQVGTQDDGPRYVM